MIWNMVQSGRSALVGTAAEGVCSHVGWIT
jgi:hypothetical protein